MALKINPYEESDDLKKKREAYEQALSYRESDSVKSARDAVNAHYAQGTPQWTGTVNGTNASKVLSEMQNRKPFTYNMNADALYQQYAKQYADMGKLAMKDTVGTVSALTGGYGNSYALTAGNQAYQQYMDKLNDRALDLYDRAYQQYQDEGNDMARMYEYYNNAANRDYSMYRDTVSDWNNEGDRLTTAYNNDRSYEYNQYADQRDALGNAYNNAYNREYGAYSDAANLALSQYQSDLSAQANADKLAEQARQYDADLAEQQRQYNASLYEKQRQYNSDLAESQRQSELDREYNNAKLAEDARQFDANLAYKKASDSASASASASGSGTSAKQKTYDMKNYQTVEEKAKLLVKDKDQLYSYLSSMVASGFISEEAMEDLYLKYGIGITESEADTSDLSKNAFPRKRGGGVSALS